MFMTFRWFGSKADTVSLSQIRQIPGIRGVIGTLYDKMPGEVWEREEIRRLKEEIEAAGLFLAGIESVNVHENIKSGKGSRDLYIDGYIRTLENLGKEGIHLVCYNFMPVFDWIRSELNRRRSDGSFVMAYNAKVINSADPEEMYRAAASGGSTLPGWEPARLPEIKKSMLQYQDVDEERLYRNLVYFLEAIMPVCRKYDIYMAIHPDDPAWSVFGLPRIITGSRYLERILKEVDDVHNGVTFCTGSFGSDRNNDLPEMIHKLEGRIHFAHIRNLKFNSAEDYEECSHLSEEGDLDMYEIVKALYEIGFDGPVRPDHGRMIWGENAMPGYGLYDRALGACYIQGVWEAVEKTATRRNLRKRAGSTK